MECPKLYQEAEAHIYDLEVMNQEASKTLETKDHEITDLYKKIEDLNGTCFQVGKRGSYECRHFLCLGIFIPSSQSILAINNRSWGYSWLVDLHARV